MEGSDAERGTPRLADELDLAWALIESSPDGIVVVDRSGTIVSANPQLAVMFGLPRQELVGRTIEDLLPLEHRQVHTAHRLRYSAAPHTRAMGQALDLWGRRADGAEFPVEISLSPVTAAMAPELVVATVRDITARRAAEQQLRTVSHLLDGLSESVWFADSDTFEITYVNQEACAQTGYSRDQLVGMTPLHLMPRFTRAESDERRHRAAQGGRAETFTTTLRRRDGVDIDVECDLSLPPAPRGQPAQLVLIVRDISLRLAQQTQERAVAELSALVADRERIARDLHDTAIQELFGAGLALQSVAMVADGPLAERLADIIDRQDQVIRQIRAAIFGLTDRRQGERLSEQAQAVVDEAARILGFAPELRVTGPVDTLSGSPIATEAVPVLREALSNVARHAHASAVQVELGCEAGWFRLEVTDDGIGTDAPGHGPGNGLRNLTKRADHLGGSLTVGRHEPTGTVVIWTAPLASLETPA